MNPLQVSSEIEDRYRTYLRSTFAPRRSEWRESFADALNAKLTLTKGPYLQAAPPFEPGASLQALVDEGVLSEPFTSIPPDVFPVDRPLHRHQERAIRQALAGHNLLIATGTGSGKTECILLPTIEQLLREAAAGTLAQPGVRALLLYPMNALANDQLRRLRSLLKVFPDITFGRYVGDTREKQHEALEVFRLTFPGEEPLPNERLSREEMRREPPHILITNFSMLEYLLLRPDDTPFFDGPTGEHWKLIALDETHVYDGADGAEIAMLLRRVRDRVVGSELGRLHYIATSATLGRGEADYPQLIQFGQALFDERFELEDIIGPRRQRLVQTTAAYELPVAAYRRLRDAAGEGVSGLVAILEQECLEAVDRTRSHDTTGAALHALLSADARVLRVQEALEEGAKPVHEVARLALGPDANATDLVALVELAVAARRNENDSPLIPARYHFWLRGLEGAFVCLHPDHPVGAPNLQLAAADLCAACEQVGVRSVLFELGACRRCRAEYVLGAAPSKEPIRRAPIGTSPRVYLLLGDGGGEEELDEDEVDDPSVLADPAFICPECGAILDAAGEACSCPGGQTRVRAGLLTLTDEQTSLPRCAACFQAGNGGDIVGRFLTDTNAPAAVIATSLYQELPEARDPSIASKLGNGRKLLAFADSRQEAAFFAPFLERTYNSAVRRALILEAVNRLYTDAPLRLADIEGRLADQAVSELVIDPSESAQGKRRIVRTWLVQELLAFDRRQALEGVGLVRIGLARPPGPPPLALAPLGLADDDAAQLTLMLLDTLRASGVMTLPEGVSRTDDEMDPRGDLVMRGSKPDRRKRILAWVPEQGSNRRRDLLMKVARAAGAPLDGPAANELLRALWEELTTAGSAWSALLPSGLDKERGAFYRLASERIELTPRPHTPRWRCDRCRQLWWSNVCDVCPTYHCEGTLQPVAADEEPNHYAALYRSLAPIAMRVQEHTAQWALERGTQIQTQFLSGDLNVLSCSTTFELGVDVGEVEAVLMRNVPPSAANYVQRAGRAGRRAGAAAMVLTLAQRRNHDLSWFKAPEDMIQGSVTPPRIIVDNPVIARRHAHSVAFAAWLRHEQLRKVGEFIAAGDHGSSADERFIAWLESHPADLASALARILPAEVAEHIGVANWHWVADLQHSSELDPSAGWLERAVAEAREDVGQIEAAIQKAVSERRYPLAGALERQKQTITGENIIGFLARKNVLPKYGFPVDVVELDLSRSGESDAAGIRLDRDLRQAIAEYAPGAEVVAGKRVWRSAGLKRHPSRGWRIRDWAVCGTCDHYRDALSGNLATDCPICGSIERWQSGTWVTPIFGFVGVKSDTQIGEAPVLRRSSRQSWFSESRESDDVAVTPAGVVAGSVETRLLRQGRIVVVNAGSGRRGYRICAACGWGEPTPARAPGKGKKDGHRNPITHAECKGTPEQRQLGHDFLTDVVEVRLPGVAGEGPIRSALYALLEGAGRLGIKRDEIDGTIHRWSLEAPASLIIYDTVPGGAGHAKRIQESFAEVVDAALDQVRTCECSPETSCYGCLRSYSNQLWHESLVRGAAEAVLAPLRV